MLFIFLKVNVILKDNNKTWLYHMINLIEIYIIILYPTLNK